MTDAYAAGLMDGEGCITIPRYKGGQYSVRLDVGMSVKALMVLESLQTEYGGTIRKTRERSERWEEAFAWGIFGKKAVDFLRRIQSHLLLKAEQARLAIRLQEIIDQLPRHKNGTANWDDQARRRGKTIRQRVSELNQKGPAAEEPLPGWIARLVGDLWLTPQRDWSTDLGWVEYSETWPKAAIMRNGIVYPLDPLVRLTSAGESSSLPTPTANDAKNSTFPPSLAGRDSLIGFLFPTPTVNGNHNRKGSSQKSGDGLATAVQKLYPTPSATEYGCEDVDRLLERRKECQERHGNNGFGLTLSQHMAVLYPTPRADSRGNAGGTNSRRTAKANGTYIGRKLNPQFVEWLMGAPIGWTDLEDSATLLSPK